VFLVRQRSRAPLLVRAGVRTVVAVALPWVRQVGLVDQGCGGVGVGLDKRTQRRPARAHRRYDRLRLHGHRRLTLRRHRPRAVVVQAPAIRVPRIRLEPVRGGGRGKSFCSRALLKVWKTFKATTGSGQQRMAKEE
jgi:hypothetical protein